MALEPGSKATWWYTPRGGYGYTIPVRVTIIRVNKERAFVSAQLKNGGTKNVWVHAKNLTPTSQQHER